MAIAFGHLDLTGGPVAGLRLSGTVASGDQREFAALASRLMAEGVTGLILDMSELGSISEDLAGELATSQRRLLDHDGEMVFVQPNVVINWLLDKRFGPLPHRSFVTVAEAAAAFASGEETDASPAESVAAETPHALSADWPVNVNESGRPDRFSFAVVLQALQRSADPMEWLEPLRVMLRRTGLGRDLLICRRNGDRLELVGRRDYAFPANGWLGSLLISADCPLGVPEIAGDGLTLPEKAFLKWCDTDVVVPVIDSGSCLCGALFVKSDRDGGLYRYRSGELLSLALLGRLLAAYMPAGEPESGATSYGGKRTVVREPELLTI
ncbi:hypothetical protein KJ554_12855 [bacterium]|nr:hypothetical protein [bacterium]